MARLNKKLYARLSAALCGALICLQLLSCMQVTAAESGSCGDGLTWYFSVGTLTVSGSGDMADYNEGNTAPWYHLRAEINRVVLPDGLSSVGDLAFYNCTSLTAVSLPNSLRSIGHNAFYGCTALRAVDMSQFIIGIGRSAFYGCESLAAISFPVSLERVGDKAFYLCESLTSVTLPQYADDLGEEAFAYCRGLLRAEIKAPIKTLPRWMFYGCDSLVEVSLPQTLESIDHYAFKRCDELTGIYYSGSTENLASIKEDIVRDLPDFEDEGYLGSGALTDKTQSSVVVEDEAGKLLSQTNTTVEVGDGMTLVTVVERETEDGGYRTDLTLSVDDGGWQAAKDAVKDTLNDINGSYSSHGMDKGATLTVYTGASGTVAPEFLDALTGRDMSVQVIAPNGNSWVLDCEGMENGAHSEALGFDYIIEEASPDSQKALETEDCYRISFDSSSKLKTEVLIKLPDGSEGQAAFLYQVEKDGSHTKLQGVKVDEKGNAHFYLASVDADTEYVVGLNVRNENKTDVIVPTDFGARENAIQRVEQIEYVKTGVREYKGLNLGDMTVMIVIGIIVAASVVGSVMFVLNKRKLKKMAGKA